MAKTVSGLWSTDVTDPITAPGPLAIGCTISGTNPTFTALCAGVSSVTIDLSCSDIGTGCAPNFPKRKIDNSATDPGISTYSTGSAVLSPTNYRVWFYSEDIQGNQETPNSLTVTFTYSIEGVVFIDYEHDSNNNGSDAFSAQSLNLSGAASAATTSNSVTGAYSFANLLPGDYTVSLTIPANYQATRPTSETTPSGTCNPVSCRSPGTTSYSVTVGTSNVTGKNFAITPLYSISGSVFVDTNKNGNIDAGESSYSGSASTIEVKENNGTGSCAGPLVTDVGTGGVITTITGNYNTGITLISGNYHICYTNITSLSPNYEPTIPTGTPPYRPVTVGPNRSGINFGITNSLSWFQGKGGDMRNDNQFSDDISLSGGYASETGAGGTPGIIFSGATNPYFSNGQASDNTWNWSVGNLAYPEIYNSSLKSKLSYDYIKSKVGSSGTLIDNTVCTGGLSNCTLSSSLTAGVYYTDDANLTLNAFNPTTAADYIFIIDGDLTIEDNIIIPVGSTATFIARNDIRVAQDVDIDAAGNSTACATPGSATGGCQIEGFFSAGRNFTVSGNGESGCYLGTVDKRLNMSGAIIVNANREGGSFTNNRDLCSENLSYPSFHITERVDFLLNAPDEIKINTNYWQEVAP